MKKNAYARNLQFLGLLPGAAVFIFALCIVLGGISSARTAISDEGMRALTEQIQRAAVTCYSIENQYPQTLEHLLDNYGVYVDSDMYIVHYEAISSNIMPEITVIRR